MASCLRPEQIDNFKKALKEKEIKMEDLLNMSTEKLVETFVPYAGEKNAKDIALLFEQKRVLKNKELGIKNAVSKLGEIGRYDPRKKAAIEESMAQFREAQQERIFSPKAGETFYNALADKIVGTHITREEAKVMFDLQAKSDAIKEASFDPLTEEWANPKDQLEYGVQQSLLKSFTADLKGNSTPLKELLRGRYEEFKQEYKENKLSAVSRVVTDTIGQIRDNSVSLLATLDNSFQARQGFNVLVNKPDVWMNGFKQSWIDIGHTIKSRTGDLEVKTALDAEIFSRPNHIMGRDEIGGILGGVEEQFPTSLPGRLPGIGRVFKGSDNAFVGSAVRMRVGLFDNFLEIQRLGGADINDPAVIKDAGKLALQMTARSKLGKTGSTLLNHYLFWAPRMIKSSFDTLALPASPTVSPFVRKEAALNLLRLVAVLGTIKAISNAVVPGSVTNDPRSTDFKNLKFGDTRFTAGIGEMSLITLASRLVPTMHNGEWGFWTINSNGIYKKLEGGASGQSPFDVAMDFLQGKAAPFPTKTLLNYLNQSTFGGKKPTVAGEIAALTVPINAQSTIKLDENSSAAEVLGVITSTVGISSNTYSNEVDWGQSTSKELTQFKEKVGDNKFTDANELFNSQFHEWLDGIRQKSTYLQLSDEQKQAAISKKKEEIKSHVFKKYGFVYRPERIKPLPRL